MVKGCWKNSEKGWKKRIGREKRRRGEWEVEGRGGEGVEEENNEEWVGDTAIMNSTV